jgi:hypothetical protein
MHKVYHKRFNINTDIILMDSDVEVINDALKNIQIDGKETMVERTDDQFTTLMGKWVVLSLGDKITVFEDETFCYGWA